MFLKKLNVFKNNLKKLNIFNSKIWIFKYQNWVIINVYVYIVKNVDVSINSVKKKKIFYFNDKYLNYSNKFNFL
jgi:hypothetical protein